MGAGSARAAKRSAAYLLQPCERGSQLVPIVDGQSVGGAATEADVQPDEALLLVLEPLVDLHHLLPQGDVRADVALLEGWGWLWVGLRRGLGGGKSGLATQCRGRGQGLVLGVRLVRQVGEVIVSHQLSRPDTSARPEKKGRRHFTN